MGMTGAYGDNGTFPFNDFQNELAQHYPDLALQFRDSLFDVDSVASNFSDRDSLSPPDVGSRRGPRGGGGVKAPRNTPVLVDIDEIDD